MDKSYLSDMENIDHTKISPPKGILCQLPFSAHRPRLNCLLLSVSLWHKKPKEEVCKQTRVNYIGRGTMLVEQMDDGAKEFSSGDLWKMRKVDPWPSEVVAILAYIQQCTTFG